MQKAVPNVHLHALRRRWHLARSHSYLQKCRGCGGPLGLRAAQRGGAGRDGSVPCPPSLLKQGGWGGGRGAWHLSQQEPLLP